MEYAIIGNSAAAIGCVEGIRKIDKAGEIAIVSSEPHHTYARPLISYLLQGKTTEEKMKYRLEGFYEENGCSLLAPRTAVSIDTAAKSVTLDGGEELRYNKLLVATGSTPFTPKMQGLENVSEDDKHFFMSLDDARKLASRISKESKVLIIGAGLIGLKCAEGIAGRVKSINVVDLAPRILSSILDAEGASLIQERLEFNNIRFHLATSVQSFESSNNKSAYGATLANGEELGFDQLVLAVGVTPSVELAKNAGIEASRGIMINSKMQTSAPDVYAAGDNTMSFDVSSGQSKVLALLPNAYIQGECAGVNMAGGDASFENAIPMNAIGFFGQHVLTAGTYEGEVFVSSSKDCWKKLFVSGDVLKGFMIIGDPSRAGIYTNLVRERTSLSSIDFDLLREQPVLAAFAKPWRSANLGGAH
ncbi:MAG: FAD-dependent oxidoreductase [Clostridiales bacterium]|jgi:NAD(P)H-nitrite reductase large subunit|nr:FAD-dependent oxidoreductase [Clostridiales bacterium]